MLPLQRKYKETNAIFLTDFKLKELVVLKYIKIIYNYVILKIINKCT